MIDLLGVGHPPMISINRRFYRALAQRGWSIALAVPESLPPPWPDPEPRQPDDPPVHFLPVVGGTHLRLWRFAGLLPLLDRLKPKAVYLENAPESVMAWQIARWARRNGAILVCTSDETDLVPPLEALARGDLRGAARALRSQAWLSLFGRGIDQFFAIANDGVRAMEAVGLKGRVTKMPLGFDPALFKPLQVAERAALRAGLGLTAPTIAYFGRAVAEKGLHVLIEALARLRHLDWQLLLDDFSQSHDAYVARIRAQLAAAGLETRTVSFHAGHDDMPRYMAAADIAVAPAVWRERYGRVVPEAMACGCAVVVSDIGTPPELVGEAGLIVPPGDVDALAAALRRLIEDPALRSRLGTRAAERARTQLSLATQADIVDKALRGLLNRRGMTEPLAGIILG